MTIWLLLLAIRIIAYAAMACGAFIAYRWIRRRSRLLAMIVLCGVAGRVAFGVLLFVISFFHLPLFASMQLGDGFWTVAPDGPQYLHAAAGLRGALGEAPSPTYVRALAAWLTVVGVSPLSSVLFNAVCYVCTSVIIVAFAGSVPLAAASLGAVTVSPALIVFGTQPLKDTFSVLLTVLAIVGVRLWTDGWRSTRAGRSGASAAGVVLIALVVFLMAGVRDYFSLLIIAAVVVTSGWALRRSVDGAPRWSAFARCGAFVVVLWLCFMLGASNGPAYGRLARQTLTRPFTAVTVLDMVRQRFVQTGGDTAIVSGAQGPAIKDSPGFLVAPVSPPTSLGLIGRGREILRGSATLFVPISVLRALSMVAFSGGHGLLFVTDLDTVVMDVTLAASLFLVLADRSRRTSLVAVFVFALVGLTMITMAYVVTNFGTLFRLRLLVAVPLWLLPAFSPSSLSTSRKGR